MALLALNFLGWNAGKLCGWVCESLDYLVTSRPTGVNLKIECNALKGNCLQIWQGWRCWCCHP